MVPVVAVVGASGSGKTTLICRLVEELTRRGRRIAVVKHTHSAFAFDVEGKDTQRYAAAGARQAAIVSPAQIALVRRVDAEPSLDEFAATLSGDADLLIVEGWKAADAPKIEIWRRDRPGPLAFGDDPRLFAVAADGPVETTAPAFDLNAPAKLADYVEQRFIVNRPRRAARLLVDGRRIALNEFTADFLAGVVRGAVGTLKGAGEGRRIVLEVLPPEK
jgi:molybdopterin-guanine dinucleotide biosynthesis protein B